MNYVSLKKITTQERLALQRTAIAEKEKKKVKVKNETIKKKKEAK